MAAAVDNDDDGRQQGLGRRHCRRLFSSTASVLIRRFLGGHSSLLESVLRTCLLGLDVMLLFLWCAACGVVLCWQYGSFMVVVVVVVVWRGNVQRD